MKSYVSQTVPPAILSADALAESLRESEDLRSRGYGALVDVERDMRWFGRPGRLHGVPAETLREFTEAATLLHSVVQKLRALRVVELDAEAVYR